VDYLVLSRKYRPRGFEEVVGQTHITRTLQRAIESGRVAQAYIFSGTRGTGKTTVARILAKALNCTKGPTPHPCNACEICNSVDSGDDVDVIEIDGASHNSVEDVRELRSNASYTPARARYKIYYIDEVHMLSPSAFNALLKVLEEPPAHVKFIFATTEPHKIPLTIQSRCQRFDFRNIPADEILARLSWMCGKEGITAEDGSLEVIARFASGSMRDGESLLDQVVSFSGTSISKAAVQDVLGVVPTDAMSALVAALGVGDAAAALNGIETVLSGGTSPRQFISEFIDYLRDCLVIKTCGAESKLVVRSTGERELLSKDASAWHEEALIYAMQLLAETYARNCRGYKITGCSGIFLLRLERGTLRPPAGGRRTRASLLNRLRRPWSAFLDCRRTLGTRFSRPRGPRGRLWRGLSSSTRL
jgi:DNA polymerase-3 subunit gamma/tau